ncbi:replication protein RepA [Fodinibius sediminis]|uniref:RepA protein n=1 Tax=Fodinibius sediminis TaxID=1214077 RepID=A0A521CBT7_9BACT|nr:replication protein RepA [Fodinibius sediminis]SMO56864.1 RepA protein [Fodinibius sediminis]
MRSKTQGNSIQSFDLVKGKRNNPYSILYVPRMFAQHPFPKSNLDKDSYWTVNGDKVLILVSGHDYSPKEKRTIPVGLPFGMIPRLLILMITTRAVLTGKREIKLSPNISQFLKMIGYEVSGGEQGSLSQLYVQLKRLLNCRVSYQHYKDIDNPMQGQFKRDMGPIDEMEFWEATYDEESNRLKDIRIKLHEHFYREIMNHAFPVKQEDVNKLRPSTLALDLYLFLCHRVFNLKRDTYISWKDLNKQFGSNYANHLDFGSRARKYLRKIKSEVYPQVNFAFEPGRLVLKKSPTPVKKLSTNSR